MIKCPNCGSTAQVKSLSTVYEESLGEVCVVRYYKCGCCKSYNTTQWYEPDDNGEEVSDFAW